MLTKDKVVGKVLSSFEVTFYRKRWSQRGICERLGITQQYLSKIMKRKTNPSRALLGNMLLVLVEYEEVL